MLCSNKETVPTRSLVAGEAVKLFREIVKSTDEADCC